MLSILRNYFYHYRLRAKYQRVHTLVAESLYASPFIEALIERIETSSCKYTSLDAMVTFSTLVGKSTLETLTIRHLHGDNVQLFVELIEQIEKQIHLELGGFVWEGEVYSNRIREHIEIMDVMGLRRRHREFRDRSLLEFSKRFVEPGQSNYREVTLEEMCRLFAVPADHMV